MKVNILIRSPFNFRCDNCADVVKKDQALKGTRTALIDVDEYCTIHQYLLHCPTCGHSILIESDPPSADYLLKAGGTRVIKPRTLILRCYSN